MYKAKDLSGIINHRSGQIQKILEPKRIIRESLWSLGGTGTYELMESETQKVSFAKHLRHTSYCYAPQNQVTAQDVQNLTHLMQGSLSQIFPQQYAHTVNVKK